MDAFPCGRMLQLPLGMISRPPTPSFSLCRKSRGGIDHSQQGSACHRFVSSHGIADFCTSSQCYLPERNAKSSCLFTESRRKSGQLLGILFLLSTLLLIPLPRFSLVDYRQCKSPTQHWHIRFEMLLHVGNEVITCILISTLHLCQQ